MSNNKGSWDAVYRVVLADRTNRPRSPTCKCTNSFTPHPELGSLHPQHLAADLCFLQGSNVLKQSQRDDLLTHDSKHRQHWTTEPGLLWLERSTFCTWQPQQQLIKERTKAGLKSHMAPFCHLIFNDVDRQQGGFHEKCVWHTSVLQAFWASWH